jgi:hypothetical protein
MNIPPPNYMAAIVQAEREREAARFRLARIAAAARACCLASAGLLARLVGSIRRPASTCSAGC